MDKKNISEEKDLKDKIEFAKYIASASSDLIKTADTKATWAFSAIGILTGALLTKIAKIDWSISQDIFTIGLISVSLLFIFLAFTYTLFVIYPRLSKGSKEGIIYFEDIATQTLDEYKSKYLLINQKWIAEKYYTQAYNLSVIASSKFKALRVGLFHMMITIVTLIATFLWA
ncbi:MAG: Pycsar system effector family protein [Candidatus Pacearchaeota archaeon]